MNSYVERVLNGLAKTNGSEKEFIQSATEVLATLSKLLDAQPKYEKNRVLERMVIPERTIIFQIPWVDDKGDIQVNTGSAQGALESNPAAQSIGAGFIAAVNKLADNNFYNSSELATAVQQFAAVLAQM